MAHSNPRGIRPRNASPSPLTPPPASVHEALSQLKKDWFSLSAIARAEAVREIVNAGLTRRYLAKCLNVADGTIRNLLMILEADSADQEAFRRNEIGLNEVLRRVRGLPSLDPVRWTETSQAPDPFELTQTILDWLSAAPSRASSARMILDEVIRILDRAVRHGKLPHDRPPAGMSREEVMHRCCPDVNRYDLDIAWYAAWASNWVVRLATDEDHWREALGHALERVKAGGSNPELW